MAWIRTVDPESSTGLLKKLFEQSTQRAGRVWHITQVMSLNPPVMRETLRMYQSIMMGESPLSRVQREMMATVVASEVGCHY